MKPVAVDDQQEKFKPKTIAGEEEKYSGDIISLKIKDSDLKDVVLYLAEFAGLNVVFDPDVRGTVTVNLQDVPWDQALEIILKQNKMGKTIEGNILRIAPDHGPDARGGGAAPAQGEQGALRAGHGQDDHPVLLEGQGRRRRSSGPRSRPAARSSSTTGPTPCSSPRSATSSISSRSSSASSTRRRPRSRSRPASSRPRPRSSATWASSGASGASPTSSTATRPTCSSPTASSSTAP